MKLNTILKPNVPSSDHLTTFQTYLYAIFGGLFTATLFYSHPILASIATSFSVSNLQISNIPTLASAGDATGLLLILPLADYFPHRTFVLVLLSLTILFWTALCFTQNLILFQLFTYLSAMTTGVIQIFQVLVAEKAPPEHKQRYIATVTTGPAFGILIARILSGVVARYTHWRYVYFLALLLNITMFVLLYIYMPSYPPLNPITKREVLRKYPGILGSVLRCYSYPALVQVGLITMSSAFVVASFWTTITFLLTSYEFSTMTIGLFGLIGAATMSLAQYYRRYIITPLGNPLVSAAVGKGVSLAGVALGMSGRVLGLVLEALLLDAGLVIVQISNRCVVSEVDRGRGNAVNTAFVVMQYVGMLAGTKVGNLVYDRFGWVGAGGVSMAVLGIAFVVILGRGPNEVGWVGWGGGWRMGWWVEDGVGEAGRGSGKGGEAAAAEE